MDLFFPKIAYASINSFIASVDRMIINPLIAFLIALGVVFFLYGLFEFIANQENEEKKTAGKNHMLWGIVGMVIMLGVFTIMNMVVKTIGVDSYVHPQEGTVYLPE